MKHENTQEAQLFSKQPERDRYVYIKFIQKIHEWLIWQDETFKNATPLSKAKHLQKEVKELISELELPEDKSRISDTMLEFADCFVLLMGSIHKYANQQRNTGNFLVTISALEMALSLKLSINKKREWGEPDKDGVVVHKKTKPSSSERDTPRAKSEKKQSP